MTITLPDPDSDHYLVDGRPVRRWHTILKDAGLLDLPEHPAAQRHLINAKHRGKQIDDACALLIEGKLRQIEIGAIHDEALPFVQAFGEFWQTHGPLFGRPVSVQQPLYCAPLDYACTPDFFDSHSVNDVKATDRPSRLWGLQLAAQALAHPDAYERRIIWLRPKLKTRRYELLLYPDARAFSDFDYDVVRELALGDYDGPALRAWKGPQAA